MTNHYRAHLRLTTVGDSVTAGVLAAHLRSEGIDARLRGDAFGPYPVTVGGMAEVEIWVPQEDIEYARTVLEEIRLETTPPEPRRALSAQPVVSALWWLVAVLLLTTVLYLRVWQYL
jgi:hypothetical protein